MVDIPSLIKDVIEQPTRTSGGDDALTKQRAFSESFGIHQQLIPKGNWKEIYEVHRKAIFKDGFKLTLNLSNDVVEEFSYRKKPLDHRDRDHAAVADSLLSELRAPAKSERSPIPSNFFEGGEESAILEKLRALRVFLTRRSVTLPLSKAVL